MSMRAEVSRAEVQGPTDVLALVEQAVDDLRAAGRITGEVVFTPRPGSDLTVDTKLAPAET
jgi:valyl-tRNA synthetase